MANRKYSDELKERAVRLAIEQRPRPLSQVARDLGVEAESLRVWVRRAEADVGNRPGQPTSADLEELKRLRKENSQLRSLLHESPGAWAVVGGWIGQRHRCGRRWLGQGDEQSRCMWWGVK
jgi:transposase